jgi:archaellum component FlaF (FlaF/FlaG flagellin family)
MKKWLTLFLLSASLATTAQTVNGYWYGSGNVQNGGSANNYLFELVINQKGTSVQGIVSYYFKNTFRSFKINGSYNAATRLLTLPNIPVTYYGSLINMEVDCPMDFVAQLKVSKVSSDMKGSFVSKGAFRNTCPEIFFNITMNKDAGNQDSVLTALRLYKESRQVWSPSGYDTLTAVVVQQRPVVNYVINNQYKERQNIVAQEIEVDADSVSVDFYDNGEVDGDSISVFMNDQLLTFNRQLSTSAIHFNMKLDTTKAINEIGMFANNLGSLPPNTALMIVSDGKKRFEVRMMSSLDKNAVVRIKRKKPLPPGEKPL